MLDDTHSIRRGFECAWQLEPCHGRLSCGGRTVPYAMTEFGIGEARAFSPSRARFHLATRRERAGRPRSGSVARPSLRSAWRLVRQPDRGRPDCICCLRIQRPYGRLKAPAPSFETSQFHFSLTAKSLACWHKSPLPPPDSICSSMGRMVFATDTHSQWRTG